jgi:hypothetical protein
MSNVYNVAVVVGSLRKASINRKVALALAELAPANLKLRLSKLAICHCITKTSTVIHRRQPTALSGKKWLHPTRCCLSRPSTTVRCRRR